MVWTSAITMPSLVELGPRTPPDGKQGLTFFVFVCLSVKEERLLSYLSRNGRDDK